MKLRGLEKADMNVTRTSSVDPVIRREGVRLTATLNLPREGRLPCVAFVHGLGSDRFSERNLVVSERLLDRGVATLLFDLSGHGGSTSDPLHTQDAYVRDVAAVFDWLLKHPRIDSDRIGVSGSSAGASATVEAVRRGLMNPAALVLRAPPLADLGFEGLSMPALVIVGSRDPLLPKIQSAAERAQQVRLEVVPDGDHLFSEPAALERVAKVTTDWFCERLGVQDAAGVAGEA